MGQAAGRGELQGAALGRRRYRNVTQKEEAGRRRPEAAWEEGEEGGGGRTFMLSTQHLFFEFLTAVLQAAQRTGPCHVYF